MTDQSKIDKFVKFCFDGVAKGGLEIKRRKHMSMNSQGIIVDEFKSWKAKFVNAWIQHSEFGKSIFHCAMPHLWQ